MGVRLRFWNAPGDYLDYHKEQNGTERQQCRPTPVRSAGPPPGSWRQPTLSKPDHISSTLKFTLDMEEWGKRRTRLSNSERRMCDLCLPLSEVIQAALEMNFAGSNQNMLSCFLDENLSTRICLVQKTHPTHQLWHLAYRTETGGNY